MLPHTCGLPQMTGGSASALELSRPARASLCYGPSDRSAAQGRLRRRAPTQPVTRPCRLPASGPIDNYPGENPPSLMVRALGAHGHSRRSDRAPTTSGLPRSADILQVNRHGSNVPKRNIPYSITTSAAVRSVGGTLSPSALAVFRFMANSNFVGCTTGRFAGFSPWRILPA